MFQSSLHIHFNYLSNILIHVMNSIFLNAKLFFLIYFLKWLCMEEQVQINWYIWALVAIVFSLLLLLKIWTWTIWARGGLFQYIGHTPLLRTLELQPKAGTWMQKLNQKPWKNAAYCLASLSAFHILLHSEKHRYIAQGRLYTRWSWVYHIN